MNWLWAIVVWFFGIILGVGFIAMIRRYRL